MRMVSIHAPVRERQALGKPVRVARRVSIHAPVRERRVADGSRQKISEFQFTLP